MRRLAALIILALTIAWPGPPAVIRRFANRSQYRAAIDCHASGAAWRSVFLKDDLLNAQALLLIVRLFREKQVIPLTRPTL
jgi:hypothetical protein